MNKIVVGGLYKHYKNSSNTYKIIGIGKYSEDLSEWVIYEAQYENPVSKLWIRPIENFTEEILFEGKKIRRFERVD